MPRPGRSRSRRRTRGRHTRQHRSRSGQRTRRRRRRDDHSNDSQSCADNPSRRRAAAAAASAPTRQRRRNSHSNDSRLSADRSMSPNCSMFPTGTLVKYDSGSLGGWVRTRVLDVDDECGLYHLECKQNAKAEHVRLDTDIATELSALIRDAWTSSGIVRTADSQDQGFDLVATLRAYVAAVTDEIEGLRSELDLADMATAEPGTGMSLEGHVWQYSTGPDQWVSLGAEANNLAMAAYKRYKLNHAANRFLMASGSFEYELDFTSMVQTNIVTQKIRPIRCKFDIPLHWDICNENLLDHRSENIFGDVAVRILDAGKLEGFKKLLDDSVYHHYCCNGTSTCPTSFRIRNAWHIENWSLWRLYVAARQTLVRQLQGHNVSLIPIDPALGPGSNEWARRAGISLCEQANEVILFHGTEILTAHDIAVYGFDDRVSNPGYYGQGTYFASQSCKAAQYCGHGVREGGNAVRTIIVSRVALGDSWYACEVDSEMRRPPAKYGTARPCDSLIARPGPMPGHGRGFQTHQEFVIFEKLQAYPEYVLEYEVE